MNKTEQKSDRITSACSGRYLQAGGNTVSRHRRNNKNMKQYIIN